MRKKNTIHSSGSKNEIKTKGVKTIWEEIQKNFIANLKEWYSDNLLYHKIGYLISS